MREILLSTIEDQQNGNISSVIDIYLIKAKLKCTKKIFHGIDGCTYTHQKTKSVHISIRLMKRKFESLGHSKGEYNNITDKTVVV